MGKKQERIALNNCFATSDVLFVHIPKCGGTSVREYLRKTVPQWPSVAGQHYRCRDIATKCDLSRFQIILAVVREPLARELSQWRFWRHGRKTRKQAKQCPDFCTWLDQWEMHHPVMKKWQNVSTYREDVLRDGYFADYLWVCGECPSNLKIVKLEEVGAVLPKLLSPYTNSDAVDIPKLNVGPDRGKGSGEGSEEVMEKVRQKYKWAYRELYTDSPAEHHPALVTPELAEVL